MMSKRQYITQIDCLKLHIKYAAAKINGLADILNGLTHFDFMQQIYNFTYFMFNRLENRLNLTDDNSFRDVKCYPNLKRFLKFSSMFHSFHGSIATFQADDI